MFSNSNELDEVSSLEVVFKIIPKNKNKKQLKRGISVK